MALNNQPYLPLYVDDWMNNNKLKLSSPAAHGLMISIMCIMHKEDTYGKILLKQKFKQTTEQIKNFASQIAKLTAFDLLEILPALTELIENKILKIEVDYLICERMVRDNEISEKRKKAGRSGGKSTQENNKKEKKFAKAKDEANTVNGIVIENVNEIENKTEVENEKKEETAVEILTESQEVILFLNKIANRFFDHKSKNTLKHVNGRLANGFTRDELMEIAQLKTFEWLNNDKMQKYLTPDTLFNSENCEKYREQLKRAKLNPEQFKKSIDGNGTNQTGRKHSEMEAYKQRLHSGVQ